MRTMQKKMVKKIHNIKKQEKFSVVNKKKKSNELIKEAKKKKKFFCFEIMGLIRCFCFWFLLASSMNTHTKTSITSN